MTAKSRPLLLTGPYLAMWIWLILPIALHGVLPLVLLPDRQVHLHVGGWMEEMDGVDGFGEAWRVLRKDRRYDQCRYIRFTAHDRELLQLPPKRQHCAFLRIASRRAAPAAFRFAHDDMLSEIGWTRK